jgi:hypothetical protein
VINGNVTNEGASTISYNTTFESGTWDNKGSLTITTGETFTVSASAATFNNDTGGSVTNGGSGTGQVVVDSTDTYMQGAGATSGNPVILSGPQSGAGAISLTYDGTGASTITDEGLVNLAGNLSSGDTLTIQAGCSENSATTAAASLTNAGIINLTNVNCSNDATLTIASKKTLTSTGQLNSLAGNDSGSSYTISGSVTNKGTSTISYPTGYERQLPRAALNQGHLY